MRRTALIGSMLALSAVALAACGGGSSTGGDPQSLVGTSYAVTTITVDGGTREVIDPVEITFDTGTVSVATPCNDMSGPVTYSDSVLTFGALVSTKMACEPALMEQDQVLADALAANPTWQLASGTLTLTGGGTVIVAESSTAP